MPEIKNKKRIAKLCLGGRQVGKLIGGEIIAVLIDDGDTSHFGLKVRLPVEKNKYDHSKGTHSFELYDVWVLNDEDGERAGFIDIVQDIIPHT